MKKQFSYHKDIIYNFIWRSLQVVSKQGIIFIIFILCAKLLSPYEFGIYNYVLAIVFFLIIFGDFGISTATSKYVAEYNTTNKEKLKAVLFNSGIIILGLTIIVILLTLIIGPYYLKDKYIYVLWLLPLIFLAPITSLFDGIYRGLNKFKQLAIISIIVGFISIFLVYFSVKQYGLIGALISQNLFYLILLVGLGLGHRDFNFKVNKDVISEIGKYSLILGIASLGFFLFTRINILILAHFNLITEIGYYELINKILLILLLPFFILAQVISPKVTETYIKGDIHNLKRKYIKYIIFSILSSSILALIVYLSLPIILKVFLRDYYNSQLISAFNLMIIVLVSQAVSTVVSIGFSTSSGYAKLNMYFLLIFGLMNLILSTILVKQIGFFGIIYSTVILRVLGDISFTFAYFYKLNKINNKNEK